MGPFTSERDACGIGFVADAAGRASSEILTLALEALRRVRHRGAVAADAKSGDGAGVLLPIPGSFFERHGVGVVFLPPDGVGDGMALVERALVDEGLELARWREVPVDPSALGLLARAKCPSVRQFLIRRPSTADAERRAFRARKRIERAARRRAVT